MAHKKAEKFIRQLLKEAGVTINGGKPYDLRVKKDFEVSRAIQRGTLGVGEAFMRGDIWCEDPYEMLRRVMRIRGMKKLQRHALSNPIFFLRLALVHLKLRFKRFNPFKVGHAHYDIGFELYENMLDKTLTYTCGYWSDGVKTLEQAQKAKLDLICRKINLKPGQKVLDIGCGWGSFMRHAAEKYGAECVGATNSTEQAKIARKLCKGLPIKVLLMDFRDLARPEFKAKFDHVISIGMFEHVNPSLYERFMGIADSVLKPKGSLLLHTIGSLKSGQGRDAWIEKYIFPNSTLPALSEIIDAADGVMRLHDYQEFGQYYAKTLLEWDKNFTRSWEKTKQYVDIDQFGFDTYSEFYNMWRLYLLSSAANFAERGIELWQFHFSKISNDQVSRTIR